MSFCVLTPTKLFVILGFPLINCTLSIQTFIESLNTCYNYSLCDNICIGEDISCIAAWGLNIKKHVQLKDTHGYLTTKDAFVTFGWPVVCSLRWCVVSVSGMLCVTFCGFTVIDLEVDCEFQELVCIYSAMDQRHIGSPWGAPTMNINLGSIWVLWWLKLVTQSVSTQESLGMLHAQGSHFLCLYSPVSKIRTLNDLVFIYGSRLIFCRLSQWGHEILSILLKDVKWNHGSLEKGRDRAEVKKVRPQQNE